MGEEAAVDPTISPEAPAAIADKAEEEAPPIDMAQVHAAGEAHSAAVETAHGNLRTRMAAAYAEFENELDRAREVWQNAYSEAKRLTEAFASEGDGNGGDEDPTRAR